MDYPSAIHYLDSLNMHGGKLGLERENGLLVKLGKPQGKLRAILVGGTSGKGSATAMIASVLQEAGFSVGRLTKPHLSRFTERICVNGAEISEKDVARLAGKVKSAAAKLRGEKPTYFEIVVAIALCYFAEKKVDFAVLEVGLGGRLDATNVCDAPVCVITNISLEHAGILGNTVEEIAFEKAGIIKENGVLVTAADDASCRVFARACREMGARMIRVGREIAVKKIKSDLDGQSFFASLSGKHIGNFFIPLLGDFQLENAACAIGAVYALRKQGFEISNAQMHSGLKKTEWPGRMEIVQRKPLAILDCAKDADAMGELKREVLMLRRRRLIVVLGISSDKEWGKMLQEIAPAPDIVIACEHKVNGRAVPAGEIARVARGLGVPEVIIVPDIQRAVKEALSLADGEDIVLVTGSVFTVGEAREIWFPSKKNERKLNETPKK